MTDSEQLAWEAGNGPKYAVAAFASGALTIVAFALPAVFGGAAGSNAREGLINLHDHTGVYIASILVRGLGTLFLAAVFYFLMKAITARTKQTLTFLWPLIFAAPVLLTVGLLLDQLAVADAADKFLAGGARSVDRAEDLLKDRGKLGAGVGQAGGLALAISFVLIGVTGMRAGLLSKFMGFLGVIAGALLILPLLPGGGNFIQLFWIVALGFLLLNRWPKGRGPAWSAVEAIPWPTAADLKGMDEKPTDAPATVTPPADGEPHVNPRAGRKRKKKKRR